MKYEHTFLYHYHIQAEAAKTLVGHTQCVSSVKWPQPNLIYSASWDHSIRKWDVDASKCELNIVSAKILSFRALAPCSRTLVSPYFLSSDHDILLLHSPAAKPLTVLILVVKVLHLLLLVVLIPFLGYGILVNQVC